MNQVESQVKVLVTGADGMLGNNIVRELVDRGFEVHCFIESSRSGDTLKDLPVHIYRGDICNSSDLVPLFRRVDYVIHTAGITSMWPGRSPLSWQVNFHAVKLLVRLSKKYNIQRFVHIGTATSFGHGPLERPGDEQTPYINHKFKLDYQDTKFMAQEYLLEQYRSHGFPVIILNPTFMLGPFDSGQGSNKMVLYLYKEKAPGFSPGGKNFVHVKDVAVAAANALNRGRLGECYITGNMNLSYRDSFRLIAETLDVKPPRLKLPRLAAVSYGAALSAISSITRKAPSITYQMARIGCEGCYYSPAKAIKELDMPQTPIEEAVKDSIQWFKQNGVV
jgi:dihydroflavonol-4-reductase